MAKRMRVSTGGSASGRIKRINPTTQLGLTKTRRTAKTKAYPKGTKPFGDQPKVI